MERLERLAPTKTTKTVHVSVVSGCAMPLVVAGCGLTFSLPTGPSRSQPSPQQKPTKSQQVVTTFPQIVCRIARCRIARTNCSPSARNRLARSTNGCVFGVLLAKLHRADTRASRTKPGLFSRAKRPKHSRCWTLKRVGTHAQAPEGFTIVPPSPAFRQAHRRTGKTRALTLVVDARAKSTRLKSRL